MEERQAIARLQAGDIGGLEVLVRRYQARAVRAAYLIVRDRALAEDLAQAAFLRAYERIGQFDADRPFGPWFLRGVVNDAIKAAERGGRLVPLDDLAPGASRALAAPAPGPEELAERAETRESLWAALGALSPAQRAAIVQRYYLGLSEAEMADALALPPGTVKSRLHAARERLRVLLSPLDAR
jgi:RNA polymerase sigma-70 factor (ECF subfamily)